MREEHEAHCSGHFVPLCLWGHAATSLIAVSSGQGILRYIVRTSRTVSCASEALLSLKSTIPHSVEFANYSCSYVSPFADLCGCSLAAVVCRRRFSTYSAATESMHILCAVPRRHDQSLANRLRMIHKCIESIKIYSEYCVNHFALCSACTRLLFLQRAHDDVLYLGGADTPHCRPNKVARGAGQPPWKLSKISDTSSPLWNLQ